MSTLNDESRPLQQLQQRVLEKLATTSFFQNGMLYGSSLLSHFCQLPRWSYDLDFLAVEDPDYHFVDDILSLQKYFPMDECSIAATVNPWNVVVGQLHFKKESITVGIDVSLYLNPYALAETRSLDNLSLPCMTLPCQLGAKTHAVLFRSSEKRYKPQDFFDLQWMIKKNIPVHLPYVNFEMQQSHLLNTFDAITFPQLKSKLKKIAINAPVSLFEDSLLVKHNISRESLLEVIEVMKCS